MVLRGRNFTSNAIGSPFPTEIPFPTRLEARFRRKFHFQRGWKPVAWTQFHFQRGWKPISDGNSISNAVGSLLRGRNSISNVFGRRHAIAKQLRHEVNRLLLRAVTMFFVFKNYPNKSSVSCSRSASCFRRWRLPCGVMISSLSKRVRMTVVTT